jgi:hypothetical protein
VTTIIEDIAATRPAWLTFSSDDPRLLPERDFDHRARLYVAADVWNDIVGMRSDVPVTMYSVPVVIEIAASPGTWRWAEDGF